MLDSTDDYCKIAFSAVAAEVAQPLAVQSLFTKTKAFCFAICWGRLQIRKAEHPPKGYLDFLLRSQNKLLRRRGKRKSKSLKRNRHCKHRVVMTYYYRGLKRKKH
jgi:hypothetical protein